MNSRFVTEDEVVYQDCEDDALLQIDLLAREVYLPLLCSGQKYAASCGLSTDKMVDILHGLVSDVEVTHGHTQVRLQAVVETCFTVLSIGCLVL